MKEKYKTLLRATAAGAIFGIFADTVSEKMGSELGSYYKNSSPGACVSVSPYALFTSRGNKYSPEWFGDKRNDVLKCGLAGLLLGGVSLALKKKDKFSDIY